MDTTSLNGATAPPNAGLLWGLWHDEWCWSAGEGGGSVEHVINAQGALGATDMQDPHAPGKDCVQHMPLPLHKRCKAGA